MKLPIVSLLLVTVLAFAGSPELLGTTSNPAPAQPATDAFAITVMNTFECSYAGMIIGLDYVSAEDLLLFTDNTGGSETLWICSPNDGTQVTSLPMTWDTPDPFGIADDFSAGAEPHCNDFADVMIWYGQSFSNSYPNPYGADGRGMDFDGTHIWEAYGPTSATSGACLRMNPGGTGSTYYDLPGITTQLSGLTTYPISSSLGIAVTAYGSISTDEYIWFFEFDGSNMTLLGSAELPDCKYSIGLTYSDTRDTYFWSWQDDSDIFHISELQISGTSLQRDTWGAIKFSF